MKILIVGAGIAGLSLSAHLQKDPAMEITIIDKAPLLKRSGFVIGLWQNGLRTLSHTDPEVYEKLKVVSIIPQNLHLADHKGNILKTLNFTELRAKYGLCFSIKREDFYEYLLSLNKDIPIKTNLSLSDIKFNSQENKVNVVFTDGTKDSFDIVIGSDGINSKVRNYIEEGNLAKSSGLIGFLMMAKIDNHPLEDVSEVWAKDKFFGIYPCICNHNHIILACPVKIFKNRKEKTVVEFLKNNFSHMDWLVKDILNQQTSDANIFYDEWQIVMSKKWYKDHVVLLGDAAHAMVPSLGMGANMALEDSYVLAKELSNNNSIDKALQNYYTSRHSRVTPVFNVSLAISKLTNIENTLIQNLRDFLLAHTPITLVEGQIDNMISVDVTKNYE